MGSAASLCWSGLTWVSLSCCALATIACDFDWDSYDPRHGGADDRVVLYVNGQRQPQGTPGSMIIVPDHPITLLDTDSLALGNRAIGGRSFEGTLFYAALYQAALSDGECAFNAAILSADDDRP